MAVALVTRRRPDAARPWAMRIHVPPAAVSDLEAIVDRPSWAPGDVDIDRPSVARVYDCLLGGSHNFEADRSLASELLERDPNAAFYAWSNRDFLRRAVKFCVAQGISQFLDIGSGIPTVGNVHEVARSINPHARVAYVDIDQVAVAHSRQIVADIPNTAAVRGDVRNPGAIVNDPAVASLIDFERPVAVLMVALLHFIPDSSDPSRIVARLREAVPSGSFLVLSHLSSSGPRTAAVDAKSVRAYQQGTGTPLVSRTPADLRRLLSGWDLQEPGVVGVGFWRPEPGGLDDHDAVARIPGIAAVARKP
jgi:hypothetical protein